MLKFAEKFKGIIVTILITMLTIGIFPVSVTSAEEIKEKKTENILDETKDIKVQLENLIDKAKGRVKNRYTKKSKMFLQTSLIEAEKIIDSNEHSSNEMKIAINNLKIGMYRLIPCESKSFKKLLEIEIEHGESLLQENIELGKNGNMSDSERVLKNVINTGAEVLKNKNSSVEEIINAIELLKEAIINLQVNNSKLVALIKQAEEKIQSNYMGNEKKELEKEIASAKEVVNNVGSTPIDVKNAINSLKYKMSGLTLNKNQNLQNELQEKIIEGKQILKDGDRYGGYTESTTENLVLAIKEGQETFKNENVSEEELKDDIKKIVDAINNLDANKESLIESLNVAKEEKQKGCTEKGKEILEGAIKYGQELMNNKSTPQEVSRAVANINIAIHNLK